MAKMKAAMAAVLVPEKPRSDLLVLLETQGIGAIWPTPDGKIIWGA